MDEELRESYHTLEIRLFHKGRIVTPSFIAENNMLLCFEAIGLVPFLTLNKPICPSYQMEEAKNKQDGPMPFTMLLTRLFNHILQTNPEAIVPTARFTFHEYVMDPLDILRSPIKEKGKKIASPSVTYSSSLSSNDNEAPSFLEFYDELFNNEDLTQAQLEKRDNDVWMIICFEFWVQNAVLVVFVEACDQRIHHMEIRALFGRSIGDSEDDDESYDNNDEGSENDDDGGNDPQDSERTDSDEEENPSLNLNVDEEEETQEEEYVHTPTDEEPDDQNMEFDDEEYCDLYKDVNVRSKVAEPEEVGKGDVEITDATRESGYQEKSYEQTSKDAEPTKCLKTKESKSSSSKDTKSQLKSFGKSVQVEELELEVADSDMPQNQEGNLGNDDEEPMREVASKRDWFTKPKQPQEPTDTDWNVGKTPQQGPT
uniref:Uncharacterized protein n=1 Tax=Tanacetum cinerariifolium TaxID=118510 RepID=A0A6L2J2I5_TANCI|nr:hypothetical protein [Tanacetum cinerariifolium]